MIIKAPPVRFFQTPPSIPDGVVVASLLTALDAFPKPSEVALVAFLGDAEAPPRQSSLIVINTTSTPYTSPIPTTAKGMTLPTLPTCCSPVAGKETATYT
jgi:hypothetical protein